MSTETKISKYFGGIREILLKKYDISKISEHPTVIGGLRASFVSNFIVGALPKFIGTDSSVEIIDNHDKSSGEVDVVIYNPYAFKVPIGDSNSILMNDSVVCAFEIKSTLELEEFQKSLEKTQQIKELVRENMIQVDRTTADGQQAVVQQLSTPCVVIGFSGTRLSTLVKHLNDYEHGTLPDLIINLSTSEILIRNDGFLFPYIDDADIYYQYKKEHTLLVYLWQYLNLLVDAIRREMDYGSTDINKYLGL